MIKFIKQLFCKHVFVGTSNSSGFIVEECIKCGKKIRVNFKKIKNKLKKEG